MNVSLCDVCVQVNVVVVRFFFSHKQNHSFSNMCFNSAVTDCCLNLSYICVGNIFLGIKQQ